MIEDKLRHQKALALIVCLFLGYLYIETIWKPYFYGQPVIVQTVAATNTQTNQTLSNPTAISSIAPVSNNQAEVKGAAPLDLQIKNVGIVRVVTKDLKVELSLLGGRITKAELLKYKRDLKKKAPLDLIQHTEGAPYPLGVLANVVDDAWVQYQVLSPTSLRQDEPGITVLDLKGESRTAR